MSNFENFIDLVFSIKQKDILEDFLIGVTTCKERDELSKRIEIVERIIAGESQQKIAKQLGVGISTVTRGSKELAAGRFRVLRNVKTQKYEA
jgi:TrpR family trp operon transcriptional repressor